MPGKIIRAGAFWKISRVTLALVGAAILTPGDSPTVAQEQAPAASEEAPTKIPPDQLDSLIAPIALYPDPMLAQVLAASTYPLEVIQLQQWLEKHRDLKDKALADAVAKQPWDPSVQALAALPDVVKRLADDIQWTTDLGNAFLAQQNDVMDAVQRMRKKAQDSGNLKSNEQQKVETKVVESKQVIVVEQANPQVVYVPSYNPTVVYGPPVYPYPPIYYPPPGYYAAGMAISFGVGVAMGAMWSGGWGWGCGWGNNNVTINNYNNFNRNTNINGGNRVNAQGNRTGNWQHNPQHRGGTPYSNRSTADRYGGTARGDSATARQASARQNQAQRTDRSQGGNRPNQGQLGGQQRAGDRSAGAGERGANRASGGGGDRIGDRSVSRDSGASRSNALGGASNGMSGNAARASSTRGSASMGSRGGRGGGGGRRR